MATKKDSIIKLLSRSNGATIAQMQKATGWQAHSIRAALTGLRKAGHKISRDSKTKGLAVYRVSAEAAS
ncbi:MAG: hypothetical protein C0605_09180 [Hyphomicrobiales bacterium]|nr:MAG: hypothetical protein C0605_09180 [Hyphomicrobiales bacterium]